MEKQAIHTEKLTKFYEKARGINGLDLDVAAGEFFGFIGPNGAGKSTTIRTLLGLITANAGSARVLGLDPAGRERKEILKRVGYLPSDIALYAGLTVKDMLKLSAGLRGRDCTAQTVELCERLQLDTGKKVEDLSFGNRKKVGIVCALQHQPELLILDEPTGGLDPLMQHEFFSILQERNREGTTVFLSSHVLSEIQRYCTRAAVIREGTIIACDSVGMLAQNSAKKVTLRGNISREDLAEVREWTSLGGTVSFLYQGDMNELIQHLSAKQIDDLTITEPDLEEIFLHFYGKGDEQV